MRIKFLAAITLAVAAVSPASAQVPAKMGGNLLFRLAYAPAGSETFLIERTPDGGYRLTGQVDLRVQDIQIQQHLDVTTDERLAFQEARVEAIANQDTTVYVLRREGENGVQTATRGDSSSTSTNETPPTSILLTNNVIHHIVLYAWLYDGELGEKQEFVAFPRVPVSVVLEAEGTVAKGDELLAFRRYFLNVANRLGIYVWLAEDGFPLRVFVPLQGFEALSEEHEAWSELLVIGTTAPSPSSSIRGDYDEEDVRFESDTILLAGTLTIPRGEGPFPAVVTISGSGGQDRDENTPGPGGLKLGIFRVIADTLTGRGIAVLRYDDRGVAESGGDLATAGLSDLVADVEAAVDYVRSRPEVDKSRVALVGHSEGGIIAPIVAAEDPTIAAIVLMAGTATPLDSVIVQQTVDGTRDAGGDSIEVAEARAGMETLAAAMREGRDIEALDIPDQLKRLGQSKWLKEHIEHDPIATLQRVTVPVLIANGGLDVQVGPEHAHRLGAGLEAVGHTDYEVRIYPDLNHLFVVSRGEGIAEYADPNIRVDTLFLAELTDWLTAHLVER
jgi:dienelactone hydrolase